MNVTKTSKVHLSFECQIQLLLVKELEKLQKCDPNTLRNKGGKACGIKILAVDTSAQLNSSSLNFWIN